jgi:hypothetical protein
MWVQTHNLVTGLWTVRLTRPAGQERKLPVIDGQTGRHGSTRRRHSPPGPASEACRAQMGRRAAAAAQARPVSLLVVTGRPGGTMAHLSIL